MCGGSGEVSSEAMSKQQMEKTPFKKMNERQVKDTEPRRKEGQNER